MEMILKVTDCKADSLTCLEELSLLLEESKKKNKILIEKGRTKIDLVGENCNVEIAIKENKQLFLTPTE